MAEIADGYKYKGEDFLFLVEIEDSLGNLVLKRFYDQTGGSRSISNDELEISTKDRTGSDYGDKTETVSLEGQLAHGDEAVKYVKHAARNKKYVKIYEVNKQTLEAEYGMYMISSFEPSYDHGDFATYSLEGALFGDVCVMTLTEIPEGAPPMEGMDCDGNIDNGGGDVEG